MSYLENLKEEWAEDIKQEMKEVCKCECHLHEEPLEHDSKCCEAINGNVE